LDLRGRKWREVPEGSVMKSFKFLPLTNCYKGVQVKDNVMNGNVARMGDLKNAYKMLVGNFEGKRALGRPVR
jgi:hypothetical protein